MTARGVFVPLTLMMFPVKSLPSVTYVAERSSALSLSTEVAVAVIAEVWGTDGMLSTSVTSLYSSQATVVFSCNSMASEPTSMSAPRVIICQFSSSRAASRDALSLTIVGPRSISKVSVFEPTSAAKSPPFPETVTVACPAETLSA